MTSYTGELLLDSRDVADLCCRYQTNVCSVLRKSGILSSEANGIVRRIRRFNDAGLRSCRHVYGRGEQQCTALGPCILISFLQLDKVELIWKRQKSPSK